LGGFFGEGFDEVTRAFLRKKPVQSTKYFLLKLGKAPLSQ
jgi:hypothetical protein